MGRWWLHQTTTLGVEKKMAAADEREGTWYVPPSTAVECLVPEEVKKRKEVSVHER